MDIRWLEDFIALADTRSFSRAAVERHVTQPAFSRRIQALEAWVGVALIDRTTYPTRLTAAGRSFREHAAESLRQLHEARGVARGRSPGERGMLTIAAGHTLAITFFAPWMARLRGAMGPVASRVTATNVHDAALALVESGCDLLLCYSYAPVPMHLDDARHVSLLAGKDRLLLVSVPGLGGEPRHDLRGRKAKSANLVSYSSGSFLGRVLDPVLRSLRKAHEVRVQCVADRSEVVHAIVLEGFGAGWIPASMVAADLASGRLVHAGPAESMVDLQIRLFRSLENRSSFVERVWEAASRIAPFDYPAALPGEGRKAVARQRAPARRR